jgi:hypothetical protein
VWRGFCLLPSAELCTNRAAGAVEQVKRGSALRSQPAAVAITDTSPFASTATAVTSSRSGAACKR